LYTLGGVRKGILRMKKKYGTPSRGLKRRDVPLRPELVPRPLWGRSVYAALRAQGRRREWESIRHSVFETWEGRCSVCLAELPPGKVCHEEWAYDYSARAATLVGFRPLCPMCNFAVHLGRTITVIAEGRPAIFEQVIEHICTVNSMTREQVGDLAFDAMLEWTLAPKGKWKVRIAPELSELYPALKNLKL
jgi:hypothetical protein